jgi:predicted lipid-binding transport protein (Tim44 family)
MMKKTGRLALSLSLLLLFAGAAVLVQDADARAGGGRSFGGSGSRSSAAPSRSYSSPNTGAPGQPSSQPPAQPAGGGFLRSMGGGIFGGLLGGMLFSSLGFGGTGGFGGGGIGLIEIILVCGIGYWIYTRMTSKRREAGFAYQATSPSEGYQAERGSPVGAGSGPDQLRLMDPSLDEGQFKETAMDIFFKVQGCWTNRDLSAGTGLLTDDMKRIFQQDIDKQIQDRKINRLENIAVRKIELVEAWQESGMDYVKAVLFASLLDYTTDDTTGAVIAGSRTEPVKFEECWTYVRSIGSNAWKLTAISQV